MKEVLVYKENDFRHDKDYSWALYIFFRHFGKCVKGILSECGIEKNEITSVEYFELFKDHYNMNPFKHTI